MLVSPIRPAIRFYFQLSVEFYAIVIAVRLQGGNDHSGAVASDRLDLDGLPHLLRAPASLADPAPVLHLRLRVGKNGYIHTRDRKKCTGLSWSRVSVSCWAAAANNTDEYWNSFCYYRFSGWNFASLFDVLHDCNFLHRLLSRSLPA